MEQLTIIILAAGQGKRMGSSEPKVLAQTISQKPLLEHVVDVAAELSPAEVIVVAGHKADKVEACCKTLKTKYQEIKFKLALQEKQLGTAHAVQQAIPLISPTASQVLILYGDVPLLRVESLNNLQNTHFANKSDLTLITMPVEINSPYGRIKRDSTGSVVEIVERKDCSEVELLIQEGNSGIYCCSAELLKNLIPHISNNNKQNEYYLTDLVKLAVKNQQKVACLMIADKDEVLGVNTITELGIINKIIRQRVIQSLMTQGVHFAQPESCIIDASVRFLGIASIGPNAQILGNSTISDGTIIDGNCIIEDSTLGNNSHIKSFVVMENSQVGATCIIGPFAHLREGSIISDRAKVGNFVETKNAILANDVKASHLSYLGDCEIGSNTNIGAGTIFANYDGVNKYKTQVAPNCFIGSNSTLIAPINIGECATIGAGSVVRKDVEPGSLFLTRGESVSKTAWKRKAKRSN
jgi:bifunctional UDP-N-acetylglucosamine pyrophosphorylase / glucosamine-1-phosphate N-acetyltransferase